MTDDNKDLQNEVVKKLQVLYDFFTDEENAIYQYKIKGIRIVKAKITEVMIIYRISRLSSASYCTMIEPLIELFLKILERRLEDSSVLEINMPLLRFINDFYLPSLNIPQSQLLLKFSTRKELFENFLAFILSADYSSELLDLALDYYVTNRQELNIKAKCYMYIILNKASIEKKWMLNEELIIDICFQELEENYEKALKLEVPFYGKNNFILNKTSFINKIPINESMEGDCLRMILSICFYLIMQIDNLHQDELIRYVKLTMKYLKFVHDPFLLSEIVRTVFLSQKQSKPLLLALQSNEGLLDVVIRYMNSYQLIAAHNNTQAFIWNPLAVNNNFQDPFLVKEINPFDALIGLLLLNYGDFFGGLMNLLELLPNFQLFMRNLILLETYREMTNIELLSPFSLLHLQILERLISCKFFDTNVMKKLMSPNTTYFIFFLNHYSLNGNILQLFE